MRSVASDTPCFASATRYSSSGWLDVPRDGRAAVAARPGTTGPETLRVSRREPGRCPGGATAVVLCSLLGVGTGTATSSLTRPKAASTGGGALTSPGAPLDGNLEVTCENSRLSTSSPTLGWAAF